MRPLNRPMFKMGGPIKEGIMQGMKEPPAINTVGSSLAPTDASGRQGYAIPLLYGAGMAAARFLPAAIRGFRAARTAAFEPIQRLDQYGAGLGRLAGFGSTAQPINTGGGASPLATALSTATGLAGLFGKLYGN